MNLIELLKAEWVFVGLKAPWFSWLAAIGLIILPIYYFVKLYNLFRKEAATYMSVVNKLAALQKEIVVRPGNGLSVSAYDSIAQIFNNTPSLISAWTGFKSK